MKKLIFFGSILFITIVSCKKSLDAQIDISTFSELEIITLQNSGSTAYLVKSKLNLNPDQKVTEYGFTYSYKSSVFDELLNDSSRILSTFNGSADQSINVEDTIYNMSLPVAYAVRPYAINKGRITLGKESTITPPSINMQKITTPDFTIGAVNSFALSNGTMAIVGGGKENRLYAKLDGSTLTFSSAADTLPIDFANEYCTTFTLGNYGYVVGGSLNGVASSQVYRYDFANNSWTKMQDFPSGARLSAVAAVVENKAYVGFGAGVGTMPADLWQYNEVSDTWSSTAGVTGEISGRRSASSFVIGKNIYIAGGSSTAADNSPVFSDNLWRYNIESKTWEVLTNCPFKSGRCFSFTYKNEGYVGFGVIGKHSNIILGYNEANAKWFGYYDGSGSSLNTSDKAFSFQLNEKYMVANFENNELLRVK